TPFDRLLRAGVLSTEQETQLRAYRHRLNPAGIARKIQTLQDRLTGLARDQTLTLLATTEKPLPATEHGVHLHSAS
ncbi:MAG: integrase, partial [Terrimesophilobacter sp.]